MPDNRFINGQQLALAGNKNGSVHFWLEQQTDAVDSTKAVVAKAPFAFRVLRVRGVMTGIGATSDSVVVKNGTDAITNVIDVSALADKATFGDSTIDDTFWNVTKGGTLNIVTVSAALAYISIECVRV